MRPREGELILGPPTEEGVVALHEETGTVPHWHPEGLRFIGYLRKGSSALVLSAPGSPTGTLYRLLLPDGRRVHATFHDSDPRSVGRRPRCAGERC